jgi:hypothetical protein
MLFSEMDIPLDGNLNWYSGFSIWKGNGKGGGMENGKGGDGKWLWVICMLWPAFLGNETCFFLFLSWRLRSVTKEKKADFYLCTFYLICIQGRQQAEDFTVSFKFEEKNGKFEDTGSACKNFPLQYIRKYGNF